MFFRKMNKKLDTIIEKQEKKLQEYQTIIEEQKRINENIIELLSQVLLKDLLDKYQGNLQELVDGIKE